MEKVINFFHHLFVPKEDNNYRAKTLHTDFLTYYLLLALFLTFLFKQTNLSNVLGYATDISIDKLYQLTNDQRSKNNLNQLSYNDKLSVAASNKAQDMFSKNYWAHYGPNGETPWNFILSSNYQYEYAGENLAKNFLFSQGVIDGWMKSPTHRDNILRKDYTDVGYAIVNGVLNGEQTTLVVQMFGKPLRNSIVKNTPQRQIEKKITEIASIPQTTSAQQINIPAVLSKESKKPMFNITSLSININFIFLSFLLLALFLDFYIAAKFHIVRISGKNVAHFIFVGFIVAGLVLITRGSIL